MEDRKASHPTHLSQAVIKLPHQLFPAQAMHLPFTQHVLASPPQVLMGFPSTMQQVNVLHFPQPFYLPASSSSYFCLCSYDTHLQPKTYHFYPSLVTSPSYGCESKRVVIEQVGSLAGGEKEETEAEKLKEEKEEVVKVMEGLDNLFYGDGEKMVLARKFVPPRLMRGKRGHSLSGHGKKIEVKQIWRPVNAKSADSPFAGVGGSSSSPPLSPPTATVPSLPCEDDLPCENTTVMVKNVPNQFRRDTLMGFLDDCCRKHQLEYDFVYLPMDFRTLDNLGYAFVNFTTAAAAMKFKEVLHNFKWENVYGPYGLAKSKKVCEITWARIQGKDALVRHFENSNFTCKTCDFLPVVHTPPRNGSNSTLQQIVGKLCGEAVSPRRG